MVMPLDSMYMEAIWNGYETTTIYSVGAQSTSISMSTSSGIS